MTDVSKELAESLRVNIATATELGSALDATLESFTSSKDVSIMAVVVAVFSLTEAVASKAITDEVSAFVVDQLCVKLREKLTAKAGAALTKRSGN